VIRSARSGLGILALGVVAVTAQSTHAFLLIDRCLDAGGRYLSGPPRCALAGNVTRPLGALPSRTGEWMLALGPACLAGGLVYGMGRVLLRRGSRAGGR